MSCSRHCPQCAAEALEKNSFWREFKISCEVNQTRDQIRGTREQLRRRAPTESLRGSLPFNYRGITDREWDRNSPNVLKAILSSLKRELQDAELSLEQERRGPRCVGTRRFNSHGIDITGIDGLEDT